ncbi:3-dehydroquinate synthase family protein [Insolitispirillum peregrinum]|uniref:3-dehydroquinate synthase n=1 Tax=Insolitispirillum peregrinum TaxID=80876 RepID=A0A1N7QDI8_9PROT|nr:hypothetical protein [Insolitispirillum peregrinum]SIT20864.1 3-dehydroquinate synthase [Insolitispirillum peregrinum]
MGAILPNNQVLRIQAQSGAYEVHVLSAGAGQQAVLAERLGLCSLFVIDRLVWDLHRATLAPLIPEQAVIFQDALEEQKTGPQALALCEALLEKGIRRGHRVGVIGGGIIQDLATFACSSLMRGVAWSFFPSTLLAMADSCIGGKSSLNLKSWKNILGNFYPPKEIVIWADFLATLHERDIRSGLAEVIKVHTLSGVAAIEQLEVDFAAGIPSIQAMPAIIHRALSLKAQIIEEDEFDTGIRLTMNYGHTFGHALEAASDFAIPHGIAVGFGADMANLYAMGQGRIAAADYDRLRALTDCVSPQADWVSIDPDRYLVALKKDKKNRDGSYGVVLPGPFGGMALCHEPMDGPLEGHVRRYLAARNAGVVPSV